jgi:hypothetical protein
VPQGKRTKEIQPEKSTIIVSNMEALATAPGALSTAYTPAEKTIPGTVIDMSVQLNPGNVDCRIPSTEKAKKVETGMESTARSLPVNAGQYGPHEIGRQVESEFSFFQSNYYS